MPRNDGGTHGPMDACAQTADRLRHYMNADSRPNLSTPAGGPVGFAIHPSESLPEHSPFGTLGDGCGRSFAEKNGHCSATRIDARRRRIVRWATDDLASCLRRRNLGSQPRRERPPRDGRGVRNRAREGGRSRPGCSRTCRWLRRGRRKTPPTSHTTAALQCLRTE